MMHPWRNAARQCLGCLVIALVGAGDIFAQDRCEVDARGECTVEVALRFAVDRVLLVVPTDRAVIFPRTGAAELSAGHVSASGPILRVFANVPWKLLVSANESTWGARGVDANGRKPATDLLWSEAPDGPFHPVSWRPVVVASGPAGAGLDVPLFLRTLLDPGRDAPGEYSIDVSYTLVAP